MYLSLWRAKTPTSVEVSARARLGGGWNMALGTIVSKEVTEIVLPLENKKLT